MKRKIVVEIDCKSRQCGDCCLQDAGICAIWGFGESNIADIQMRCPECLQAEQEAKR